MVTTWVLLQLVSFDAMARNFRLSAIPFAVAIAGNSGRDAQWCWVKGHRIASTTTT